jgi:2'-5' RNA ligase
VTEGGRRPRWPGADLPGRRLFIAVPFPSEAESEIASLVERVRADGVPGGGRDVRWVRLDSLHLTLRFLGPTLEDRIEPAAEATRAAATASRPFDISIGGAGSFPSAGRPRALWLDVRVGQPELIALAASVDAALRDAGWAIDDKPLRAHLTLARADGVAAGAAIGARLVAAAADLHVTFRAAEIGLFESVTGGGPARYEPIEVATLG